MRASRHLKRKEVMGPAIGRKFLQACSDEGLSVYRMTWVDPETLVEEVLFGTLGAIKRKLHRYPLALMGYFQLKEKMPDLSLSLVTDDVMREVYSVCAMIAVGEKERGYNRIKQARPLPIRRCKTTVVRGGEKLSKYLRRLQVSEMLNVKLPIGEKPTNKNLLDLQDKVHQAKTYATHTSYFRFVYRLQKASIYVWRTD